MSQPTGRPPQAPAPTPAPTPGGGLLGQATTASGAPIPITREEVAAIRARREELSNQLLSAVDRRDELAEQLLEPNVVGREGIQQRIDFLDARILRLEADIAETGEQLTAAGSALVTNEEIGVPLGMPFGGMSSGQLTGISIVFIMFVLAPLVIAMGVRWLRRPTIPESVPVLDVLSQRMERLEQAMDAVAVEVERISEGQRFVTRLLGEGQRPAEEVRVADAERVRRGGA